SGRRLPLSPSSGSCVESVTLSWRASFLDLCRAFDRAVNALIGATPADVALHGGVALRVGGLRALRQQRRRRHDLARLAVAALRYLLGDPCLLQRMRGGR